MLPVVYCLHCHLLLSWFQKFSSTSVLNDHFCTLLAVCILGEGGGVFLIPLQFVSILMLCLLVFLLTLLNLLSLAVLNDKK